MTLTQAVPQQEIYDRLTAAQVAIKQNTPVDALLLDVLKDDKVLADDGSRYDTVQAAENAASSWIKIPPATFNEAVVIDTDGLVVMGSGRETLIDGGTTGHAIDIQAANVVLRDLSVQTTAGQGNSFSGIAATSGNGGNRYTIYRVSVIDADDRGIEMESGVGCIVSNCIIEACDVHGIDVRGNNGRHVISNCRFNSGIGNIGVLVGSNDGNDSIVSSCICNSVGGSGMSPNGDDQIWIANRIHASGDNGIVVQAGNADIIVAKNRISNSSTSDIADSGTNTTLDSNVTGAAN